jgi:hypothetical protein
LEQAPKIVTAKIEPRNAASQIDYLAVWLFSAIGATA